MLSSAIMSLLFTGSGSSPFESSNETVGSMAYMAICTCPPGSPRASRARALRPPSQLPQPLSKSVSYSSSLERTLLMIPEIVTPSLSPPLPREPSRAGLGKHFSLFLELPACLTGLDLVWLFQHHLTPSTAPESLFPLLPFPCPEGCRLIPFGDELIVDFNSLRCFPGKHAGERPTPAPRRRQQGQCQDRVPGALELPKCLQFLWTGLDRPEDIPSI